jgi:hypothetical protein
MAEICAQGSMGQVRCQRSAARLGPAAALLDPHLTMCGGSRSDTSDTVSVARMLPPIDAKITANSSCVKLCDRPCAGRSVSLLHAHRDDEWPCTSR